MNDPNEVVQLSDEPRATLVTSRITCPFIGSAVQKTRMDWARHTFAILFGAYHRYVER